jgi:hypothetical protein
MKRSPPLSLTMGPECVKVCECWLVGWYTRYFKSILILGLLPRSCLSPFSKLLRSITCCGKYISCRRTSNFTVRAEHSSTPLDERSSEERMILVHSMLFCARMLSLPHNSLCRIFFVLQLVLRETMLLALSSPL